MLGDVIIVDERGNTIEPIPTMVTSVIKYIFQCHTGLFQFKIIKRGTYRFGKKRITTYRAGEVMILENPEIKRVLEKYCDLPGNPALRNAIRYEPEFKKSWHKPSNKEMIDYLVNKVMAEAKNIKMSSLPLVDKNIFIGAILTNDGSGNLRWELKAPS